jgi:hypothetical protein
VTFLVNLRIKTLESNTMSQHLELRLFLVHFPGQDGRSQLVWPDTDCCRPPMLHSLEHCQVRIQLLRNHTRPTPSEVRVSTVSLLSITASVRYSKNVFNPQCLEVVKNRLWKTGLWLWFPVTIELQETCFCLRFGPARSILI